MRGKSTKLRDGFFKLKKNKKTKKNHKICNHFAELRKKGEKYQINKIRNERGDITIDNTEIKKSIRDYYEQLYTKKLDNLEEMDIFLETHNLSKLNWEEIKKPEQTNNK